ncbi:MAG: hypothetical protein C0599_12510 [Salinivirgaceae bacterium]|nr:MAG: hypothetical protein C0599_12510 [Salinivirgaceae bacterium]
MLLEFTNKIKLLLIASLLLGITHKSQAQECVNFHKKYCISYEKDGYAPLIESRSFQLMKGEYVNQDLTFNNGQDYHINVAVDDMFGNRLYMQIIDLDKNKVLYTNTEDNMNLNLEFSALETVNVRITLETPASNSESTYEVKGCLGLLIETRPTPPTGFLK